MTVKIVEIEDFSIVAARFEGEEDHLLVRDNTEKTPAGQGTIVYNSFGDGKELIKEAAEVMEQRRR